jgi:hypothetical protein
MRKLAAHQMDCILRKNLARMINRPCFVFNGGLALTRPDEFLYESPFHFRLALVLSIMLILALESSDVPLAMLVPVVAIHF